MGSVPRRYSTYLGEGEEELRLEHIWENEIMANFEKHWDYINNRPRKKECRIVASP